MCVEEGSNPSYSTSEVCLTMVREGWYVGILLCAEDWNSPASNTGTILKHNTIANERTLSVTATVVCFNMVDTIRVVIKLSQM